MMDRNAYFHSGKNYSTHVGTGLAEQMKVRIQRGNKLSEAADYTHLHTSRTSGVTQAVVDRTVLHQNLTCQL
jgi:hypothetical protein